MMQNMAGETMVWPGFGGSAAPGCRRCRTAVPSRGSRPATSQTFPHPTRLQDRQTDLTGDITSTKTFLLILITSSIHTMASRSAISRLTPRAIAPRVAVPRQLSTAAAVSRAAVATTPMARVTASPSRYLLSSIQQQRRMASSESEAGGESMVSLSREAQSTGGRLDGALNGARPLPPAPHTGDNAIGFLAQRPFGLLTAMHACANVFRPSVRPSTPPWRRR